MCRTKAKKTIPVTLLLSNLYSPNKFKLMFYDKYIQKLVILAKNMNLQQPFSNKVNKKLVRIMEKLLNPLRIKSVKPMKKILFITTIANL